jgi:hypothetical protein
LFLVAAAISAAPADSAWRTEVEDLANGVRSIALFGSVHNGGDTGVAIICTGIDEGVEPSIVFASPASLDYSVKPGAELAIYLGESPISQATVIRNDSANTVLTGPAGDLNALLEAIASSADPAMFSVEMAESVTVSIQMVGFADSVAEFRTACGMPKTH